MAGDILDPAWIRSLPDFPRPRRERPHLAPVVECFRLATLRRLEDIQNNSGPHPDMNASLAKVTEFAKQAPGVRCVNIECGEVGGYVFIELLGFREVTPAVDWLDACMSVTGTGPRRSLHEGVTDFLRQGFYPTICNWEGSRLRDAASTFYGRRFGGDERFGDIFQIYLEAAERPIYVERQLMAESLRGCPVVVYLDGIEIAE